MDGRPFCPRSVQRGTSWCGKEPGVRREEGWAGGQCVCPGPLRTRCQDRIKWARIVSTLRKMPGGGEERRREPEKAGRAIRPGCKVDPSLPQARARRSGWGIPDCHLHNRKKLQRDRQGVLEAKPSEELRKNGKPLYSCGREQPVGSVASAQPQRWISKHSAGRLASSAPWGRRSVSSKILIVATAGNQGQLSPHRGLQGRTLK